MIMENDYVDQQNENATLIDNDSSYGNQNNAHLTNQYSLSATSVEFAAFRLRREHYDHPDPTNEDVDE